MALHITINSVQAGVIAKAPKKVDSQAIDIINVFQISELFYKL
jgi:hypothetical protein